MQLLRKFKSDATELTVKDNSEGFLLLETGRTDAFVADRQVLATLILKSRNPAQYKLLDQVLSTEPIAIMLPRGDAAFKNVVDQSIVSLVTNGDAARIYDKWFLNPIPPQNVIVGLPATQMTKAAWANPTDKPMEGYEARWVLEEKHHEQEHQSSSHGRLRRRSGGGPAVSTTLPKPFIRRP